MVTELQIFETHELAQEEKTELNTNIDRFIEANKNNRHAINRLVFESVAAMTEADAATEALSRKGVLSRWVGGITGSNQKLQNKINKNRAIAQYASQQTLQKLAEQNLMTFDLVAAVNNKLNASINNVNNEFVKIYEGLRKFFRHNRNELARLETRLEKAERNINLLTWQNSIEYLEFNGIEYSELDTVSKIVCLTRDFYEITKGKWSTSDLLLLKTAMATINIQPKEKTNYFNALKTISDNKVLLEKLLGGQVFPVIEDPSFLISMSTLKKLEACRTDEKYTVDAVSELLTESGVETDIDAISATLTKKYLSNIAFVNVDMDVECYDFILDLLYNLRESYDKNLLTNDSLLPNNSHNKKNLIFDDETTLDSPQALFKQGWKYEQGDGVPKDLERAKKLYEKAALKGSEIAKYRLDFLAKRKN